MPRQNPLEGCLGLCLELLGRGLPWGRSAKPSIKYLLKSEEMINSFKISLKELSRILKEENYFSLYSFY